MLWPLTAAKNAHYSVTDVTCVLQP